MPAQGAKNNAGSPWNPDERQVALIGPTALPKPLGLLAELTHRCPLGCPYCSNPRTLDRRETELDTATWVRVMQQAAALGILHVHLSGGEPAARRDLAEITAAARTAGLYCNLITSAVGIWSIRDHSLAEIWINSPAFNAFRGTAWMKEPCVSCPRREQDFGGCRCQAFALTGDAAAADPVCHLSPAHGVVAALTAVTEDAEYSYRHM
jgi:radical SAM protein with 4Fe4S-binding SPASM domain